MNDCPKIQIICFSVSGKATRSSPSINVKDLTSKEKDFSNLVLNEKSIFAVAVSFRWVILK